ncbi:uncharacterized protein LOC119111557 [Pollicipes pollicipes]|uniref:uncharacterized protein LOC119111557 n=1 Tax=Pollicipes pollicipes TaxID=41117 RepID=UPI001884B5B8|nr:uncharacterized protein LOC119111557 [Pollicipes pollicipes]
MYTSAAAAASHDPQPDSARRLAMLLRQARLLCGHLRARPSAGEYRAPSGVLQVSTARRLVLGRWVPRAVWCSADEYRTTSGVLQVSTARRLVFCSRRGAALIDTRTLLLRPPRVSPDLRPAEAARARTTGLLSWVRDRLAGEAPEAPAPDMEDPRVYTGRYRPEELSKLAQNSRFTRKEIQLMYRGFKQECPTGLVDEAAFKLIFAQYFPQGDANQYAHYVFNTLKPNQCGQINFEVRFPFPTPGLPGFCSQLHR